jgi:hypothetical protein
VRGSLLLCAYDPSVTAPPAEESAREVRRILLAALLAALVAAPVALVLMLRDDESASRPVAAHVTLFASTFREAGFVAQAVTLEDDITAPAATTRLRHEFAGSTTAWLVARCDTGSITVQVGSLSSSRACTGRPVGVAAIDRSSVTDDGLDVVASVTRPQRSTWGVAVYR